MNPSLLLTNDSYIETIITCFPQQQGEENTTNLQKLIRNHFVRDKDTRPPITTACEMATLILSLCMKETLSLDGSFEDRVKRLPHVFGASIGEAVSDAFRIGYSPPLPSIILIWRRQIQRSSYSVPSKIAQSPTVQSPAALLKPSMTSRLNRTKQERRSERKGPGISMQKSSFSTR